VNERRVRRPGLRSAIAFAAGVALAAGGIALAATTDADLDRVMSALALRKHGHVTFVEKKFIAVLDKPVESSGELLYDAPDRLEKRTQKPKAESLVLQNGIVEAQRGKRHYVLDLKQYPQVVPFIESIRATLAGDRAALERVFKVDFSGSFEQWRLSLAPLDAQLGKTVKEIHIEGERDLIHTVEILEADGDRSLLTIGADVGE
jgi:Outer membrane lipoprotein carrier protein LolA-like